MTKDGAKSLTEPCLLSGIGGDLILGIPGKTVELSHILMDGHLSLSQIAELFLLALHQLIQNVVPSKGNTELLPSHYVTIWLHRNIVLPPLKAAPSKKYTAKITRSSGATCAVSSLRSMERSQSSASRGSEEHQNTGGFRRIKS